jgi:hypothetical protein
VEKQWFIYAKQIVIGPLATDQVKARIAKGEWRKDVFIWWKGQREWLPLETWEARLPQLAKAKEKAAAPSWYIDTSGDASLGPMTEDEMIDALRGVSNLARARIWSAEMANWTSVYAVADVMDLLGISRRAHERAPLMGTIIASRPLLGLAPVTLRAASISVSGLGVNGGSDLRTSDSCQLLLKCAEFPTAGIHLQADVIYVMANGYAGLRFEHPSPEAQSLIHDYIKRFLGPLAGANPAAARVAA